MTEMKTMDCKTCSTLLPDLLPSGSTPAGAVAAHLAACAHCQEEWQALRATWLMLDEWDVPEPSAYFDSRLYAKLREAEAAPPESRWERLMSYLRFSTGRSLRPAMAGGLALAMLLGGGTAATLLAHHGASANVSPTVNDLRIYDKNAQALQQLDLLDDASPDAQTAPQS